MCHESAGSCSKNGSLKDWLRASVGMPGDCANVRPALPEDHSAWLLGQHGMCFVSRLLLRTQGITVVIMDSLYTMLWLWPLVRGQRLWRGCVQDLSVCVACACVLEALMSTLSSALRMEATPMSLPHAAEDPELSQQAFRAALSLSMLLRCKYSMLNL